MPLRFQTRGAAALPPDPHALHAAWTVSLPRCGCVLIFTNACRRSVRFAPGCAACALADFLPSLPACWTFETCARACLCTAPCVVGFEHALHFAAAALRVPSTLPCPRLCLAHYRLGQTSPTGISVFVAFKFAAFGVVDRFLGLVPHPDKLCW